MACFISADIQGVNQGESKTAQPAYKGQTRPVHVLAKCIPRILTQAELSSIWFELQLHRRVKGVGAVWFG